MNTLRSGQTVWLEVAGERCEITELIGTSSHAQTYRASYNGHECIVKWYFPECATKSQRAAIELLIQKGAPSDRFIWPLDTALCQGFAGFGFMMPQREERYRGLAELMSRDIDPTFRTLTNVGIELVDSFLRLHSLGLCYSSLSFESIAFDPLTGDISLSGNEYVVADGEGIGSVLGTPRFMAPEIVCGHARPCAVTDHYSLAVILFYLLTVHHPMDGRQEKEVACLDLLAMQKLYGYEPVFIFDPKHGTNRPVAGVHNNATLFWNLYPSYLRDLFIRAFTTGIDDPGTRVKEGEWRSAFTRMRDQIFYCHKCGAENFLTSDDGAAAPVSYPPCWSCGEAPIPPMRLRLGTHSVVLNQDTLLYAHHLDLNRRNDYSEIMAEMVPHPKRPDTWGLKNVSPQKWTSVSPTGTTAEVTTGRSVSLVPGLRIRFGNVEGIVG